jgi:hypothetical protein
LNGVQRAVLLYLGFEDILRRAYESVGRDVDRAGYGESIVLYGVALVSPTHAPEARISEAWSTT